MTKALQPKTRVNTENMVDTGKYSFCMGCPAEGCKSCVEGAKVVLFVTGLCPRRCFYCPVSEHKFGADDVYADEWKLSKDPAQADQELLEECRLIEAKGAGITGGDPLATLAKTTHYIQLLKKQFGKAFHIHLYTSLNLLTQKTLEQLHDAGLDEIRFHPDLQDSKLWERLILTKQFCGDAGIEIPAIPGLEKETRALLDFLGTNCPHIRFINFNELEFSDTEAKHYTLGEKGFVPKDRYSYAVKGSAEMTFKLMQYCRKKQFPFSVYFCTSKLKDAVQLRERLKRRAKNVALPFDEITKDGVLIRGVLTGSNVGGNILSLRASLLKLLNLQEHELVYDPQKNRLLMDKKLVKKHKKMVKQLGLTPSIVAEYPTWDAMEVEIDFL